MFTPASNIRDGAVNSSSASVEVETIPPFNSKQITAAFLKHTALDRRTDVFSLGHHYSYSRKFSFFPSTKDPLKATRKREPTQLVLLSNMHGTLIPNPSPPRERNLVFSVTPHQDSDFLS